MHIGQINLALADAVSRYKVALHALGDGHNCRQDQTEGFCPQLLNI